METRSGSTSSAAPPPSSGFPDWRRNMWLLCACNLLSNIGFTLYFPFIPLILGELGAGESVERWTGYYSLVLYTATLVLMPIWGGLADHFGKRSMMLRASIGQLIGFSALAWAPSLGVLILLVVWIGASNGFKAASQTLVATNTPPANMGRALSTMQSGALIGTTLGPVLGGVLAGVLPSYQWLYAVGGVLSIGTTSIVLWGVRETTATPAGPFRLHVLRDLHRCLRVPGMALLYYLMFLFASTFFGSLSITSLFTLELLGGRETYLSLSRDLWLSMVAVALTLSSAAALPVWGRLLDRYELRRATLVALALCVVSLTPFAWIENPLQLALARLVLGVAAVGLQPALLRLVKESAPSGMEARALAFGTSFYMLGHGAAPWLAGELAPWIGLRGYFAVHTVLVLSGLLMWGAYGLRRTP